MSVQHARVFQVKQDFIAWQRGVFEHGARKKVVRGGRRCGKTGFSRLWALKKCEQRGAEVWFVGPSYKQMKLIGWRKMLSILPPSAISAKNETDLTIDFPNKARLSLKGSDNEDSLRGPPDGVTAIGFEEAAFHKPHVWEEILEPQTIDQDAEVLFISSPKGRNWFWRLEENTRQAVKNGDGEWAAWNFTIYDNAKSRGGVLDDGRIERMRQRKTERVWRTEYLAEYDTAEGLVYPDFSEQPWPLGHIFAVSQEKRRELAEKKVPIYRGFDWGLRNPTACLSCYVEDTALKGKVVRFFMEHYRSEMTIPQHARILRETHTGYDVRATWADASMRNRTDLRENRLTEFLKCGIRLTPATRNIDHRIELVTRFLREGKVSYDPSMVNTISEYRTYEHQDPGDSDDKNPKEGKPKAYRNHAMDAQGYCLVMLDRLLGIFGRQGGAYADDPVASDRHDPAGLYLPEEPVNAVDPLMGMIL